MDPHDGYQNNKNVCVGQSGEDLIPAPHTAQHALERAVALRHALLSW